MSTRKRIKAADKAAKTGAVLGVAISDLLAANERTIWLLGYLDGLYPLGVSSVSVIPVPNIIRGRVGMGVMRGLIKRGWAHEPTVGLFYITEKGRKAAETLKSS